MTSYIEIVINAAQRKVAYNDENVYNIDQQCIVYRALELYREYVRIFGTEKEEQKLDQIKKEIL